MTAHPDPGPELRKLAQAILDRLDPSVRAAAARAAEALRGPGRCQQVWCPVCALAALATGEEHPLLTVVAEHSVALLAVVRAAVADPRQAREEAREEARAEAREESAAAGTPAADGGSPDGGNRTNGNGHYQRIPIVVEVSDAPEDWP